MNRPALVSLLVLAGCHRGPDALEVRVQLAPQQVATCVELQMLSNDGEVLDTQRVARTLQQQELHVALFQGELPDDIQLWARALWGSSGCDGSLYFNGQSALRATRFSEARIESLTVVLDPPSPDQDVDQDGFAAHVLGGPDCDDQDPRVHPGAHEACLDPQADLNCDGHHGCDDATCAGEACTPGPRSLALTAQ